MGGAEHIEGHLWGDEGVPVPIPTHPRPEAQRAGARVQCHAPAVELNGQVLQELGNDLTPQLIEYVDDGGGLLERTRLGDAQLVRLPQPIDHLRHMTVDSVALVRRQTGIRPVSQQPSDLTALVDHRAAGGFGRMCGEHRLHVELVDQRPQCGGIDLGQPAGFGGLAGLGTVEAVHLFRQVGQMEVRAEGAHQADGLRQGQCTELIQRRPVAVATLHRLGCGPNPLDALEERGALLTAQGVSQLCSQTTDVRPQAEIGLLPPRVHPDASSVGCYRHPATRRRCWSVAC